MQMPEISSCNATQCAYNMGGLCHALAITIGDGQTPQCDTFCSSSISGGDSDVVGCVGACKVASCVHNMSLECQAPGISVGTMGSEIDCLTFRTE